MLRSAIIAGILGFVTATTFAAEPQRGRPAYIVSDMHLNVGRAGGADWNPLEDFRWPNALRGMLERISAKHPDGVDFVIAGDFLELWQHPTISCTAAATAECGCTIEEMKRIVTDALRGHQDVLVSLRAFLARASNRIIVTPGNHDAALMIPDIWNIVREAIPQGRDRFLRANNGTWISDDGAVAVEHGHQQKFDVNYFPHWPTSVTRDCAGTARMFRPWGENFVQSLYNKVEAQFPIIDNLVPDSAGVALYSKYSGVQGRKSEDVARFVIFNILETSLFQKFSVLSIGGDKKTLTKEDVARCRKCFKEELVLRADPDMRSFVVMQETQSKGAPADGGIRAALAEQVQKMDEPSVRTLCERVAVREGILKFPASDDPECGSALSMVLTNALDPDGTHVLRERVQAIVKDNPSVAYYIFGHTHEARDRMAVRLSDGTDVAAFNTGAFQRLIDEKRLLQLKRDKETEIDLLARLTHQDLKPCYSLVAITYTTRLPRAQLMQWYMDENDAAGKFLHSCSVRCSAPPANCKGLVPASADELE